MGQTIPVGDPPIEVKLRRSARARRMTLRVSRFDGRVTLSIPQFVSAKDAVTFARSRETWLRSALDDVEAPKSVSHGAVIPFRGEPLSISTSEDVRRTHFAADQLWVRPDRPGNAVRAFLKTQARDRLVTASDACAKALGVTFCAISLRDTRSRWGSCTSDGRLMYSWRLIMAPDEVLDYVVAHEVSHLVHLNHSKEFWSTVESICPDFQIHRRWLKDEGPTLMRYAFSD